ncbi:MAG TPA: type II secretion system F family protein [Acidimicrobiales bacterium]|nr:type II secretion system F family protein [Acidimicrobiales bacterium]
MSAMTSLAIAGMAAGAIGLLLGLRKAYGTAAPVRLERPGAPKGRPLMPIAALVLALVTLLLTRWPVAALLVGVAGFGVPRLLRALSADRTSARVESVATWTELLRDTLSAASGLNQAIVATAELAPKAIRGPVMALAERLTSGVPMDEALRYLADEIDDPSADLVVCALLLASTSQTQKLADLLGALADASREEVAMRLRVEASRASSRSSVRTVMIFSLGFALLMFVAAHSYLSPFGTAAGQIVLVAVGACYAAGLTLMVRLVRPRQGARLLVGRTAS